MKSLPRRLSTSRKENSNRAIEQNCFARLAWLDAGTQLAFGSFGTYTNPASSCALVRNQLVRVCGWVISALAEEDAGKGRAAFPNQAASSPRREEKLCR